MDTTLALNNYVGIPYEFAGSSHDSADCIGLVRLFYKEHNWKPDIYDGPFYHNWYVKTPFRMIRFFIKNMNKIKDIKDLQFGDVVYFTIGGEGHVGIYYKYGRILTTFPDNSKQWDGTYMPNNSFLCHRQLWERAYRCGFRRR